MKSVDFSLSIAGKDVTRDLSNRVISIDITDYLEGQSDEISVVLENNDRIFLDDYMPTKGDDIKAKLGYKGKELFDYGAFEIDEVVADISASGSIFTINGLSTGLSKANRSIKAKEYENTTLESIAKKIADETGLKLVGQIESVQIKRETQFGERNVEFLARISKKYHHAFSIKKDKMIFYKIKDLQSSEPVKLDYESIISLSVSSKISNSVKKVKVKSLKQQEKKCKNSTKDAKGKTSEDTLTIVLNNDDNGDKIAQSALDTENEKAITASVCMLGTGDIAAGMTVEIEKVGKLSGKYFVKSATHSLSRSGFTTSLEVHKVE